MCCCEEEQNIATFVNPLTGEKIEVFLEVITPEMAESYLEKNIENNRKPDKKTVQMYERNMRDGMWFVTGDSIKFSKDGVLQDGKHRLLACKKAEAPFVSFVMRGISDEAVQAFDTGRLRSAKNFFEFAGVAYAGDIAAAAKRYILFRNNRVAVGSGGSKKFSTTEIFGEYKNKLELYKETTNFASSIYKKNKLLARSLIIAIMVHLICDKNHTVDEVKTFFNQFSDIEESCQAIRLLRQKLVNDKVSVTTKMVGQVRQVFIMKAWNAYIEGKDLKYLSYNQERDKDLEFK